MKGAKVIIKQGQPFVNGVTYYPEGPKYEYDKQGHRLLIAYNKPRKDEIKEFKGNSIEFGLLVAEEIIFLLYRFKRWQWADCPYNIHLVTPDMRALPSIENSLENQIVLPIVFLDATTGIVKGHRHVLLSPEFSKELLAAIENQSKNPITLVQQSEFLIQVYQQYTVEDLVNHAVCRCIGKNVAKNVL